MYFNIQGIYLERKILRLVLTLLALRQIAVDNQARYHNTGYAVLNNFSMDDYLGSVKNPEIALMLSRSLVELLKLGGSNLTKLISNVPNFLQN